MARHLIKAARFFPALYSACSRPFSSRVRQVSLQVVLRPAMGLLAVGPCMLWDLNFA